MDEIDQDLINTRGSCEAPIGKRDLFPVLVAVIQGLLNVEQFSRGGDPYVMHHREQWFQMKHKAEKVLDMARREDY